MSEKTAQDYLQRSLLTLTAVVPFSAFLIFHAKGGTVRLFNLAYSTLGIPGIVAVPVITISMEKTFYESVCSYQGIDTRYAEPGAQQFPHGGSMLPSFSLVSINRNGYYYDPKKQSKFSPHFACDDDANGQ